MITLDRLRYFIEAATLEHVGNAAKILAVSPSVVSTAIRELEEELGCELFIREKQRIELTDRGEILLGKAKIILNETNQLYSDVATGDLQIKGHYRIGASHFLMQEYLISAFIEIQKDHPQLTVEFNSLDTGMAISRLLSGELDAILVFRSSHYHELDETVLYSGQFQIAVRNNHPIFKIPRKMFQEKLNVLPAITFRTLSGPNFWGNHPAFKISGIVPNHTYFYEDTQTALQLLLSTNGWAFLPDKIVANSKSVRAVHLTQALKAPVNISLIIKKDKPTNSFIERLKDILKTKIEE